MVLLLSVNSMGQFIGYFSNRTIFTIADGSISFKFGFTSASSSFFSPRFFFVGLLLFYGNLFKRSKMLIKLQEVKRKARKKTHCIEKISESVTEIMPQRLCDSQSEWAIYVESNVKTSEQFPLHNLPFIGSNVESCSVALELRTFRLGPKLKPNFDHSLKWINGLHFTFILCSLDALFFCLVCVCDSLFRSKLCLNESDVRLIYIRKRLDA